MKKLIATSLLSLLIGAIVAFVFSLRLSVSFDASTAAAIYSGQLRVAPSFLRLTDEQRYCTEVALAEMKISIIEKNIETMRKMNYFGIHNQQIGLSLDAIKFYESNAIKKSDVDCERTKSD